MEKFLQNLLNDKKCGLSTLYKYCVIVSATSLEHNINDFIPYQITTLTNISETDITIKLNFGAFNIKAVFVGKFDANGKGKITDVMLENVKD